MRALSVHRLKLYTKRSRAKWCQYQIYVA